MRRTSIMPYMADRLTHSWAKDSLLSHSTPENGFRSRDGFLAAGELLDGLAPGVLDDLDVLETPDF